MAHNRVRAGSDHFLVFGDLDGRRAERVLPEHPVNHPHGNNDQDVAGYGKPGWHVRPAETAVKGRHHERSDARKRHEPYDEFLDGSLLRTVLRPAFEEYRVFYYMEREKNAGQGAYSEEDPCL